MPLSPSLLEQLRAYWRLYRPRDWLFAGRTPGERLSETSIQRAFTQAKARAGAGALLQQFGAAESGSEVGIQFIEPPYT